MLKSVWSSAWRKDVATNESFQGIFQARMPTNVVSAVLVEYNSKNLLHTHAVQK